MKVEKFIKISKNKNKCSIRKNNLFHKEKNKELEKMMKILKKMMIHKTSSILTLKINL